MIRLYQALQGLYELPLGGTAVGTGLNAHADYAIKAADTLAELTGLPLSLLLTSLKLWPAVMQQYLLQVL